ncbi:MAG: tetratricopeptide repeat protein [Phycisphaeraceae bacterium]
MLSSRDGQREQNATRLVDEAEIYLERGLEDSALAAFGLALEENPRLTRAHMGMGRIYLERGNYTLAEPAYQRAAETEPNNDEARYHLGLVRQLRGGLEEAVRTYLRALAINPDHLEANRDIASAYLQLGRAGDALPHARRAVQLNPESQPAWANLGAAYSLVGRYDEARDAYRQAIELGGRERHVLLGLAEAHIKLGNYRQAVNVLDVLLEEVPDFGTAHERMGLARYRLGAYDQALDHYQRAHELDERDTAALNGIGACLMTMYLQDDRQNLSLRRRAINAWQQSLRLQPNQPRISDLIARFRRS